MNTNNCVCVCVLHGRRPTTLMAEFHLALAPVSGDMHGAPVINVISSTKATVQDSASFSCDT